MVLVVSSIAEGLDAMGLCSAAPTQGVLAHMLKPFIAVVVVSRVYRTPRKGKHKHRDPFLNDICGE